MYNDNQKNKRTRGKKSRFFNVTIENKSKYTKSEKILYQILNWENIFAFIIIAMGFLFYLIPNGFTVMMVLLGIIIMAYGGYKLLSDNVQKKLFLFKKNKIHGLLNVIFGLALLLSPFILKNNYTIIIGLWFIYLAIAKIEAGILLYKEDATKQCYILNFLDSGLLIFIAIVVMLNPFQNLTVNEVIGIFLALSSILNITTNFMLRKTSNSFM